MTDPRIERALAQLAAGAGAIAAASRDISTALSTAAGATSGTTGSLNSSMARLNATFRDLETSISPGKIAFYQLSKAIGQLVNSHMQTAGQMLRLNRTIYESDDVFSNMNAQFEVGTKSVENLVASMKTALSAIPLIGPLFGESLQAAGDVALKLANEHFQRIIVTSRSVSEAFKKTNDIFGPLTANMDSFSLLASRGGLESKQFGKIMVDNAGSLRTAFGSLRQAANYVSENFEYLINTEDGDALHRQFRSLGYDVDDIAAALSEYAELQSRSGRTEIAAGADQVKNTYAYVKNLKTLQALTGVDIKTQKQKRKEEEETAIYQSRLRKIRESGDKQGVEKFEALREIAGLAGKDAAQAAAAFYDTGNMMNKSVAGFAASAPEYMNMIKELTVLAKDQTVTADEFQARAAAIMQKSGPALEKWMKSMESAKIPELTTYVDGMSDMVVRSADTYSNLSKNLAKFRASEQTYQETRKTVDEAGKGGALDNLLAEQVRSQMKDRSKYENELLTLYKDSIPKANDFLKSLTDLRKKVTDEYGPIATKVANAMIGFAQNTADFNAGLVTLVRSLNKIGKEDLKFKEEPKAALGGIVSGPKSGYNIIAHGTEAVVPLPNNRSIPVTLDTSKLEAILASKPMQTSTQTAGMSTDLIKYLESSSSLNYEILRQLKRGNEISEKIYRATV